VSAAVAAVAPPPALAEATRHQPRAAAELASDLSEPTHAYIFRGPPGSGKAAAARAFAAELLAAGAPDPDDARRRAMLDPSPHPDLVWLLPPGAQHLVDEVRESVIRASSLRPAEGDRRVFVIEEAEALRDESQNALLKTLEEPAPFAHLILLCSEPELLAGTILSRCRAVDFAPLAPEAVLESIGESGPEAEAASRLCAGDVRLARMLLTDSGRALRSAAVSASRAPVSDDVSPEPWRPLLAAAEAAGAEAGEREEARLLADAEFGGGRGRSGKLNREATDQVKRTERRARTQALDLGLALCCAWFRDLGALSSGAPEVVLNADRTEELRQDADGMDPAAAAEALDMVLETRRRLRVNVSEELALEALWLRLSQTLPG
jgi:DNA polymerase-3 subunit delta'